MNVEDTDDLSIDHFLVGPMQTNIYLIGCKATGTGAIVDAGGNTDGVLARAEERGLELAKILQTHAHIDHVGGLAAMKERTDAPIYLHEAELEMYNAVEQQGRMFGMQVDQPPEPDAYLEDGDTVELGDLTAEVLLLPGHSPGGIAFLFRDQGVIFSGDVLFAGSIGRVDLPGSDRDQMNQSLARLKKLDDAIRVLSGHGPETTIGQEKNRNPFM